MVQQVYAVNLATIGVIEISSVIHFSESCYLLAHLAI